jgi:hypothetical protein
VKRQRRLRRLVPDAELIRRRAAGASLRKLAVDFDVAHTTLVRYFKRADVAKQLKQVRTQLRAEQRAIAAQEAEKRRAEQAVRQRARQQGAHERRQVAEARATGATTTSRRRKARTPYEAWLDERDAARPLTRSDRRSQLDDIAEGVVAAGGGLQAVIDETGLRTRENVLNLIDPEILVRAFDNDALNQTPLIPPT